MKSVPQLGISRMWLVRTYHDPSPARSTTPPAPRPAVEGGDAWIRCRGKVDFCERGSIAAISSPQKFLRLGIVPLLPESDAASPARCDSSTLHIYCSIAPQSYPSCRHVHYPPKQTNLCAVVRRTDCHFCSPAADFHRSHRHLAIHLQHPQPCRRGRKHHRRCHRSRQTRPSPRRAKGRSASIPRLSLAGHLVRGYHAAVRRRQAPQCID